MDGTGERSDDGADGPAALELRLLDPAVRADRAAVDRLLHRDFVELSRRSSVWMRDEDGRWRVRFHQGTPVPT